MRLAASNIGWGPEADAAILRYLQEEEFEGLEIAPTRVFPEDPYSDLKKAAAWSREIRKQYDLEICSMQSIWFGRTERIAESEEARKTLLDYMEKALRFADAVGCRNVVFGCPQNRALKQNEAVSDVEDFLLDCAELAENYGVVIALEANPEIYHTNYLNTTQEVLELVRRRRHPGLKLNLDYGTMIENREKMGWIKDQGAVIHHVHISEPMLIFPKERSEHRVLADLLRQIPYKGFVSLEMGRQGSTDEVIRALSYLKKQFS